MGYWLKNKNVALHIDFPQENYQMSRFDWTGKITSLSYKGIPLTTIEDLNCKDEHRCGKGFYNEFGIETALGFEETNQGDWFHKIGVGLLQKEGLHYKFQKTYKIKPAHFTTKTESNAIQISCKAPIVNGYAYALFKEIILRDSGFSINYTLQNTGKKKIQTSEYTHNFMAFNQDELSPNFQLKFPFKLQPALFGETVNPEAAIAIGKKEVSLNRRLNEQFYFSNLSGDKMVNPAWELWHRKTKIGIREQVSFKSNKIHLWGWSHVISPELFHEIEIAPNAIQKWTRSYEIFDSKLANG